MAADGVTRAVRLSQLEHLLYKNAGGMTSRELCLALGVSQRTVQRDLQALQAMNIPVTQDGNRYGIMQGYVLPPVSFSLYEAAALFLAARLVYRGTDEENPHIGEALRKLAQVLPQPFSFWVEQTRRFLKERPPNPAFIHIFEKVALAWVATRRLRLRYRSLKSEESATWLLDPYLMEVTGVGYSTYVIGRASKDQDWGLRTFKLDRILEAELLAESYTAPQDTELATRLARSWGIIWGDEEVQVRLKFSPQVARRVKESVWHPSQVVQDLAGGGVVLTVRVSSTLEMTPWIRGWGPDVEVLSPASLREEFADYAQRLGEIYGQ